MQADASEIGALIGRQLWLDGSIDNTFPNIKNWLDVCVSQHAECSLSLDTPLPRLPKRVIDVGNESKGPRLRKSDNLSGLYATLSHRWGDSSPLTTTKATLKNRLQGIPLSSLPRTFQDAVLITRQLGLQYLWIDSLCIIQDDTIDWEIESVKMASIYQGAQFTIAAAAAQDGHGGCLFPRKPAVKLELESPKSPQRSAKPGTDTPIVYLRIQASENRSIAQSSLGRRGWALQEALLSRRTIYFAQDQIFWQCARRTVSEDGTLDLQYRTAKELWKFKSQNRRRNSHDPSVQTSLRNIWWKLVEDYSSRQLSRKTDKLAALAGITTFFHERSTGAPLAGLWVQDLHFGLLWTTKQPVSEALDVQDKSRPEHLHDIPSWSWLSIDGPVQAPKDELQQAENKLEIISQVVSWSSQWLSSRITHADIKVRGLLTLATLMWQEESPTQILTPLTWYRGAAHGVRCNRYGILNGSSHWQPIGVCSLSTRVPRTQPAGSLGKASKLLTRNVWCLRISTNEQKDPNSKELMRQNVLLLEGKEKHKLRDDWVNCNKTLLAECASQNNGLVDVDFLVQRGTPSSFVDFEEAGFDMGEFTRIGVGEIKGPWGRTNSPKGKAYSSGMKTLTLV